MRTAIGLLFVAFLPALTTAQDLPAEFPHTYPSRYFAFFPEDSTSYPAVYPDQSRRDSITARFDNPHQAARAVERYALRAQDIQFAERNKGLGKDSLVWTISYASSGPVQLAPNLKFEEVDSTGRRYFQREDRVDWTFEYYYRDEKLAVFRKWKEEGTAFKPNGHLLFSREAGRRKDLLGRPVFSPSMDLFVTLKGSVSAGPTDNAIQLFRITDDNKISHILTYKTVYAPSRCKWIDDDTLMLEAFDLCFSLEGGYSVCGHKHYRIEIRKPRH